ncbi:DUF3300 domain-containing protein [Escherichia albertii]|nr:DUF3300 domain-containing protein [Escherichia albertii]
MKITLPFKPHVLALICSAGLCAISGTLYVKSRTVETQVAPQAAPDVAAVTLPATVSAPPVMPAVVKSAFSTAQIDQWVAPVALYPDALLSQVLMASTYPANVAQAVQWSHDNPLKQGDAAIQAVSDQPWDASVKSLVAFPQLMALMGENPEWVQNLGDAFLAQPQEVMDSVQRLRKLAQQTGSLKSSVEQKIITTTKKAVPTNQTATAPITQSNTVSTSSPVIAEPAQTVISIEPATPDVVYIPNYNPTVVYGSWGNTAYPPVYLPPPAGEPFVDSFVRGFGYSMGVATTYALFSNIDWDDDDHDHHHHDSNGWQHNGDNININVDNFNRITGEHLTDKNMAWQHNPNYRDGVPYHDQDMAKRFHQTDVKGGMSATQLPAPTRDSQRQAAAQKFNEAEHYGNYDDFREFSHHQSPTQQQKDAARQRYQSATPEQRQAFREKMNEHPLSQQQRDSVRQRIQSATPEQRQAFRNKMQTNPQNQQQRDNARQRIQSATPEQRQTFRQNVQKNNPNLFNNNHNRTNGQEQNLLRNEGSSRTGKLNDEQRSAIRERVAERPIRHFAR